jgi:hypothetical protein
MSKNSSLTAGWLRRRLLPLSRPRGHSRDYGLCGSRRNSRHWAHRESKTRYLARLHEETDEENGTAPIRRFDGDVTSRGLDRLLEGGHGRAPRKGSVHRTQSSGDGFDAALAVNFRCSRWTKVFTKQCLALGVALWVPRSRWLLDWWREQQTAYPRIATPVARHDAPSVSVPELWLCFAVPLSFFFFEDEGRCLGHLHSFRASRFQ